VDALGGPRSVRAVSGLNGAHHVSDDTAYAIDRIAPTKGL
jgi:hypothetical protein